MALNSVASAFEQGGPAPADCAPAVRAQVPGSRARDIVGGYAGEERLTGELEDCVARVLQIAGSEPLIVSDQVAELAASGRRLRPVLVLAAAHCASRDLAALLAERAVRAGVVVELLHLASVVHNDVLDDDEASAGPGAAAVSVAREGNLRSVLAGDYLLAQALAAASALGRSEAAIAARTFIRLCEGQAQESVALFDAYRVQDTYFAGIAARSGALFESSFRLGAMSGSLGLKPTAALAEYGMALGIAVQLREDARAFTDRPADSDMTDARRPRKGIADGVYTLPLLLALREQPYLTKLLRDPDR
ncbi:MAG: polyprenyl synthetase family protein, partial [Actinocrinis sp.]